MEGEFKVGDKIDFNEVLVTDNGTETQVGTPNIKGAKVTAEIVEIGRSAKVIVARYMQKNRSGFKKNGHRQPFFKVKILSI
jgi:large subunit ribosomal protein L21